MSTSRVRSAGVAAVALLILEACTRAVVVSPPAPPPAAGPQQTGLASWYGQAHQGKPTASGEVYDPRDLTAAHRTLPLGTRLMVTNLDNGRAVEVRVNDRGPFVDGRILDLSYGAATLLDATAKGVVPVRLRVMEPASLASPVSASPGPVTFSLQLATFTSRDRADALREAVARTGSRASLSEAAVAGETFYRVRVGPYPDRPAAEAEARRLAARGYVSVVVIDR
jgi:peptidoglycan lytic transglycosylase